MNKRTEEIAEVIETRFIEEYADEDSLPVFDFEINLNEVE
jgi:hypothetical protein